MKKEYKKSDDYEVTNQRVASLSAWLDETLQEVLDALFLALNETKLEMKDQKVKSLINYLHGVQDGNRFAKTYPYNEKNQPPKDGATRIIS